MKTFPSKAGQRGSAMVVAVIFSVVLLSMGITSYIVVNNKYRVVHQAANWQESLLVAEAGIDFAMNEIRKTLYDPANAFSGTWRTGEGETYEDVNGNGQKDAGEAYTDSNGNGEYDSTGANFLSSEPLDRTGEGGTQSTVVVTVDKPIKDAQGEPYYRIRAVGITDISGSAILAGEKTDLRLRKLSLHNDRRTNATVTHPQARRYVEAIAKPIYAFRLALMAVDGISMNNHNIVVDSFDSEDATKSVNGNYPFGEDPKTSAKIQWNGDIATNGPLIEAGNAQIYGTAGTNNGQVTNDANVSGHKDDPTKPTYDNYYQEVIKVSRPVGVNYDLSVTNVKTTTVLQAGLGSPTSYILDAISLQGSETLTLKGKVDASGNPVPSYIQIVVKGDTKMSGNAEIILEKGVYARVFVEGNVAIAGNGFTNPGSSLNLQIYGVTNDANTTHEMTISGNSGFSGAVYAPEYDITLNGGGQAGTATSSSVIGSFVGKDIRMVGITSVHYDEALGRGGLISDYQITSWFEEDR